MTLDRFDAVLLDLDGTIYHEDHPLPGAIELIRRLQDRRLTYACITNSTTSPQRLSARLRRMEVEVDPAHIYTAGEASTHYILDRFGPMPRVFNLATEGIAEMLDGKVHWVQRMDEPCDVVIAGTSANVYGTEERQRIALTLLRNGSALVGICADRVYPSPRGIEFGSGAFCAMLGYAARVEPVFCGKPQPVFFTNLCQKMRVDPKRCVLIGDNLESDISGGKALGMHTVLTMTGVTGPRELETADPRCRPDQVIQSLLDLQP